jgi:hypothetical protein
MGLFWPRPRNLHPRIRKIRSCVVMKVPSLIEINNPLNSHPTSVARHGLPMRGCSHFIICRYGSPLDGTRSLAFSAKGLACSSVCRFSFGRDIHSRMIFRRASCSGFMFKILWSQCDRRHSYRPGGDEERRGIVFAAARWPPLSMHLALHSQELLLEPPGVPTREPLPSANLGQLGADIMAAHLHLSEASTVWDENYDTPPSGHRLARSRCLVVPAMWGVEPDETMAIELCDDPIPPKRLEYGPI